MLATTVELEELHLMLGGNINNYAKALGPPHAAMSFSQHSHDPYTKHEAGGDDKPLTPLDYRPPSMKGFNVAHVLQKRSLLIAINCIAGLSICTSPGEPWRR